jgi:hypothetical protein
MMKFNVSEQGQGKVISQESITELRLPAVDASGYHNAQISDYDRPASLARSKASRQFRLKSPLRLSLTAHASTSNLHGTAGFGFWNHPFAPNESGFRLPQALWFFFSSPPNRMTLAKGMPETGWKAATFNAKNWPFYALAPTAPLAVPLMNLPFFYDALWPIGQKAIGINEYHMDKAILEKPHHYALEWREASAKFFLDGKLILEARDAIPNEALGFVAWLDNQYAIVSPKGNFGYGLIPIPQEQSLFLRDLLIEELKG